MNVRTNLEKDRGNAWLLYLSSESTNQTENCKKKPHIPSFKPNKTEMNTKCSQSLLVYSMLDVHNFLCFKHGPSPRVSRDGLVP